MSCYLLPIGTGPYSQSWSPSLRELRCSVTLKLDSRQERVTLWDHQFFVLDYFWGSSFFQYFPFQYELYLFVSPLLRVRDPYIDFCGSRKRWKSKDRFGNVVLFVKRTSVCHCFPLKCRWLYLWLKGGEDRKSLQSGIDAQEFPSPTRAWWKLFSYYLNG